MEYFDAIPLKESFAIPFLDGLVTEAQIRPEHVIAPEDIASARYLFLAGLAVKNPETHSGRRNANILVWSLLKYIEHYYGTAKPLCVAVAATESGNELLRRFRLRPKGNAHSRVDRYQLYSLRISKFAIRKRLECIPDWEFICRLDWQTDGESCGNQKTPTRPILPKTRHWQLAPE